MSLCMAMLCTAGSAAADEPRRNVFDDPFVQLTRAQGCVGSDAESQALEALVRGIDDVELVVNELAVVPDARSR